MALLSVPREGDEGETDEVQDRHLLFVISFDGKVEHEG